MRKALIVSKRGLLTLPTALRKRFGIKDGRPIILEDQDNALTLKPAIVLEVEMYTDSQISEWNKTDRLEDAEKNRVLKRLKTRKAQT